jgi:hypothetical protein
VAASIILERLPFEGVLLLVFPRPGPTPCTWLTTLSRNDLTDRCPGRSRPDNRHPTGHGYLSNKITIYGCSTKPSSQYIELRHRLDGYAGQIAANISSSPFGAMQLLPAQ